jgi:hypothetical protein
MGKYFVTAALSSAALAMTSGALRQPVGRIGKLEVSP